MDQRKRRTLVDLLLSSVTKYEDAMPPLQEDTSRTRLMVRGDTAFSLELDKYENLLENLLLKEGWGKKFTEEYISKALTDLLFRIQQNETRQKAAEYFDELVSAIESYSQQQIVYIPLDNITMQYEGLEIGKISLKTMTDERVEELAKKIEATLISTPWSQEDKQKVVHTWLRHLKGKVCAEYSIIAEPDRARERAEEECRRVLDLLRFSIQMLCTRLMPIGLMGEAAFTIREIVILAADGTHFQQSGRAVREVSSFNIDTRIVCEMERIGIFKVAEILKQETNPDEFNEILLRGIHWLANAQTQVEKENQLLSLMTCLEVFLTTRGMERITNTVAEGVAFVLASTLEDRKYLKKRVVNLYSKRSGVSHGGNTIISKADLEELRNIVGQFLQHMIHIKDEFNFKKREDLDVWIENQKLQ